MHDGRKPGHYRKGKEKVGIMNGEINGSPFSVRNDEIGQYIDDSFATALSIYNYTKLWGLPNGAGWANEPLDVLESITALELEAKTIERKELENKTNNGNKCNSDTETGYFRRSGVPKGNIGHKG